MGEVGLCVSVARALSRLSVWSMICLAVILFLHVFPLLVCLRCFIPCFVILVIQVANPCQLCFSKKPHDPSLASASDALDVPWLPPRDCHPHPPLSLPTILRPP